MQDIACGLWQFERTKDYAVFWQMDGISYITQCRKNGMAWSVYTNVYKRVDDALYLCSPSEAKDGYSRLSETYHTDKYTISEQIEDKIVFGESRSYSIAMPPNTIVKAESDDPFLWENLRKEMYKIYQAIHPLPYHSDDEPPHYSNAGIEVILESGFVRGVFAFLPIVYLIFTIINRVSFWVIILGVAALSGVHPLLRVLVEKDEISKKAQAKEEWEAQRVQASKNWSAGINRIFKECGIPLP